MKVATENPSSPLTGTSRRTLLLVLRSSAGAALIGYAVNLAIVPFVLERVGADLYGAWATMASILAVGALADAGIRTEIIRRVGAAQGDENDEALVSSVHQGVTLLAVLAAAIAVVGVVAAPAIRGFAFPGGVPGYGAPEVDLLIRATFALLAASLLANGYFGVLRGVQRGDVETNGQMISVPLAAAVTVVGVSLGWGLWALYAGSLAGLLASSVWNLVGTRRLVPGLRLRIVALPPAVVKGYLALSGLALLSQVSEVVDSQWDKIVLSRYVGSASVASFQIGTNLVLQGKLLALLPLAPLLVAISELRRRDHARMEELFSLMARAGSVLGAVVLGAIFVFAPAFVRLWLGADPSVAGAGAAARLFTVAVALNLVSAPLAFRAFGEGWHALAATGSVVNMVVNGALSLGLTMAIGFNGALYGSIAGNLVGTVFFFVLMRRRMGDQWTAPPWRAAVVGIVASAAVVLTGASHIESWLILVPACAIYAIVVGVVCSRVERLSVFGLLWRRAPA
jgi:O-antigen/teichoic acid export membrane protein